MQHGSGAPYLIVAPVGQPVPVVLSSPHSGQSYPAGPAGPGALDAGAAEGSGRRSGRRAAGARLRRRRHADRRHLSARGGRPQSRCLRAGSGLAGRSGAICPGCAPRSRRVPAWAWCRPGSWASRSTRAGSAPPSCSGAWPRRYRPYHAQLARAGGGAAAALRRVAGAGLPFDADPAAGDPRRAADRRRAGRPLRPQLPSAAGGRRRATAGRRPACSVARNRPYAGGHITELHGRPALGSHALQLELRRAAVHGRAQPCAERRLRRACSSCWASWSRC